MKLLTCLFFLLLFILSDTNAQNKEQKLMLLDSIFEKTSILLALKKTAGIYSVYKTIRLIDLTGCYQEIGSGVFADTINFRINKTIPFNLNNGEFRDIIFTSQKVMGDILNLEFFLCEFEPNYDVQRGFLGNLTVELLKNKIKIRKFKLNGFN
jgi:hypothetical protein